MASSVIIEEDIEVPCFGSLAEFRQWAASEEFPDRGRIDYIGGQVEMDMSPENVFFHGSVKTETVGELRNILRSRGGGYLFSDRMRVSCDEADLSAEPDVVYLTDEALNSGRVRLVQSSTGEPDSFVELEGAPELVVEIVSDSSVVKDTLRLPVSYWQAGVLEYWLIDVRGERLFFQIHDRGPEGFEPLAPDAEGFQRSAVFERRFRLFRERNPHGRWMFDLQSRAAEE
jgi:Uma2 family endonuclease